MHASTGIIDTCMSLRIAQLQEVRTAPAAHGAGGGHEGPVRGGGCPCPSLGIALGDALDATGVIAPVWQRFLSTYPEVHLKLQLGEAPIDIVAKGFDAGVGTQDRAAADMVDYRLVVVRDCCAADSDEAARL
jgi:DNA-binding transcriptional LysR family regulator